MTEARQVLSLFSRSPYSQSSPAAPGSVQTWDTGARFQGWHQRNREPTASRDCQGWKGPPQTASSKPRTKAGSFPAGDTGWVWNVSREGESPHTPPRAAWHTQGKKKLFLMLRWNFSGFYLWPVLLAQPLPMEQEHPRSQGAAARAAAVWGQWGLSRWRAGRARRGAGLRGTNRRSGQRGKAGGSGGAGRETRPMASREARAGAGLGRRSPSALRKGGASQWEAAVVTGEPMASRAGGAPANQGASGEQKGLSKAPAPLPSTISHDATAAGSGSRAVPAAAIL